MKMSIKNFLAVITLMAVVGGSTVSGMIQSSTGGDKQNQNEKNDKKRKLKKQKKKSNKKRKISERNKQIATLFTTIGQPIPKTINLIKSAPTTNLIKLAPTTNLIKSAPTTQEKIFSAADVLFINAKNIEPKDVCANLGVNQKEMAKLFKKNTIEEENKPSVTVQPIVPVNNQDIVIPVNEQGINEKPVASNLSAIKCSIKKLKKEKEFLVENINKNDNKPGFANKFIEDFYKSILNNDKAKIVSYCMSACAIGAASIMFVLSGGDGDAWVFMIPGAVLGLAVGLVCVLCVPPQK